jgi:serine/threonine protein phosphatase PrpC
LLYAVPPETKEPDLPMRIVDHAALTHVGLRRELNEDNYAALPELGVWAVADGMGGHDGGEIASEIARDQVIEGARLRRSLPDTVEQAHREIMEHPMAGGDRGMGTTLVAMQAHQDNDLLELVWVGDSRAYVLDAQGLKQRSKDQTKVQSWIDEGVLSVDAARTHPYRNVILQALGIQQEQALRVDGWSASIVSPTRVLLCSDGLTEHVTDAHLSLLLAGPSCQQVANVLVQAALDGGGSDNITVIVVDLDV